MAKYDDEFKWVDDKRNRMDRDDLIYVGVMNFFIGLMIGMCIALVIYGVVK